jgi:hypothetical protein
MMWPSRTLSGVAPTGVRLVVVLLYCHSVDWASRCRGACPVCVCALGTRDQGNPPLEEGRWQRCFLAAFKGNSHASDDETQTRTACSRCAKSLRLSNSCLHRLCTFLFFVRHFL